MIAAFYTNRCHLRPLAPGDLDDYYRQINNDVQVMQFLPPYHIPPRSHTRRHLQLVKNHWQRHGFGLYAVIYQEHAKLIGYTGLEHDEHDTALAMKIGLGSAYWGRGLGKELGAAILELGFSKLNAPAISTLLDPRNTPAQALCRYLGLHLVDTISTASGLMLQYRIDPDDERPPTTIELA